MVPFQQGMYYFARNERILLHQRGPTCPRSELSYEDLEIGDGGSASLAFIEMMYNPEADISAYSWELIEVLGLDTLGMVKIFWTPTEGLIWKFLFIRK